MPDGPGLSWFDAIIHAPLVGIQRRWPRTFHAITADDIHLDQWAAMFPGAPPGRPSIIPKARALCMAFSALGQQMTGLPIDFKIQEVDWANEYHRGPREALFLAYVFEDPS